MKYNLLYEFSDASIACDTNMKNMTLLINTQRKYKKVFLKKNANALDKIDQS